MSLAASCEYATADSKQHTEMGVCGPIKHHFSDAEICKLQSVHCIAKVYDNIKNGKRTQLTIPCLSNYEFSQIEGRSRKTKPYVRRLTEIVHPLQTTPENHNTYSITSKCIR